MLEVVLGHCSFSREEEGQYSNSHHYFITVCSFEMTQSFESYHYLKIISNSPKHRPLPFFKTNSA